MILEKVSKGCKRYLLTNIFIWPKTSSIKEIEPDVDEEYSIIMIYYYLRNIIIVINVTAPGINCRW
jgi:hypothetical protein